MADTESPGRSAAQTGWDFAKYITKDNVAILALVVSVASFVTSYLTYEARKFDNRSRIDRIQFHAFYDDNWDVTLFQVAGDTYHLPEATFVPIFVNAGELVPGTSYRANLAKFIKPEHAHPFYHIGNTYERLCERQKEDLCSRSALRGIDVVYKVHDDVRGGAVLKGE